MVHLGSRSSSTGSGASEGDMGAGGGGRRVGSKGKEAGGAQAGATSAATPADDSSSGYYHASALVGLRAGGKSAAVTAHAAPTSGSSGERAGRGASGRGLDSMHGSHSSPDFAHQSAQTSAHAGGSSSSISALVAAAGGNPKGHPGQVVSVAGSGREPERPLSFGTMRSVSVPDDAAEQRVPDLHGRLGTSAEPQQGREGRQRQQQWWL